MNGSCSLISTDEWYITFAVIEALLFLVTLCSVVTTKTWRVRRNRNNKKSLSRGTEPGKLNSVGRFIDSRAKDQKYLYAIIVNRNVIFYNLLHVSSNEMANMHSKQVNFCKGQSLYRTAQK